MIALRNSLTFALGKMWAAQSGTHRKSLKFALEFEEFGPHFGDFREGNYDVRQIALASNLRQVALASNENFEPKRSFV